MKYAVEMDSVTITYITSFIKIGSGTQKLMEGGIQSHKGHMEISLTPFSQNKGSGLRINKNLRCLLSLQFAHLYRLSFRT
jgi:hypothetical protein